MLKLYYEGWKTVGKPISIGKINSFKFKVGEDPNSVLNSWAGTQYGSPWHVNAVDCDVTPGDGFDALRASMKLNEKKELFTDEGLTVSTGVFVEKTNTSMNFKSADEVLYGVPMPQTGRKTVKYELCSIYDGNDYDAYLQSIADYEKKVVGNNAITDNNGRPIPPMSISPLSAPFVLYYESTIGASSDLVRYVEFYFYTRSASNFLSFATLYKAYTGLNVVQVDKFTSDAFLNIEPAVVYNPISVNASKLTKAGGVVYLYNETVDKFPLNTPTISNAPQEAGVPSDVTAMVTEKTDVQAAGVNLGEITALAMPFVQIGSQVPSALFDQLSRANIKGVFEDLIYSRVSKTAPLENPRWLTPFSFNTSTRRWCIVMTVPLWNVSKELKDDPSRNYGLLGEKTRVPLFVVSNITHPFKHNHKFNVLNVGAVLSYVSADNDFSKITGAQYSQWFYNGQVVDAGEKPMPPSEIPEDNGNGGFNDQDHLGGNGTWSDTTVDMTPDRNNPIWNIPQSLGLDGNYTIVKMSRSALESLASQTWTEKGWLEYLATFSKFSRAGDGVSNIKTCFANIPSGNNTKISAIAGYALNEPIPCSRIDQYIEFNMGTVDVPVYFGSFLDYSPYTELVLELPFAQPVQIPPEVVVGHSIGLKLYADVMSDTAMYVVHCNGRLIAQVPADIFVHIPFAASEYSQSAASALSGYVASAGGIGSEVKNAASNAVSAVGKAMTGNFIGAAVDAAEVVGQAVTAPARMMHEVKRQEETRKITQISRGGGPGAIGAMTAKYAVLKISRPYVTIPPRYYELNGCPSGFVKKVGECSGYLEVGAIYGAIKCNEQEFAMITEVLAGGVYP